MAHKRDISGLLSDWPFQTGQLNARLISGEDGEPKVQIRLDLGIIQMNADGRPDGQTPFGFPSLLEYYEAQFDDTMRPGEDSEVAGVSESVVEPTSDKRNLASDDVRALHDEAIQYYHRYVALTVLEDHERVVRDTTRNLRVLDFIREHAQSDEDKGRLEQFRPYITMIRARGLASLALKDDEPKAALFALDEGLEALRRHFADRGMPHAFEQSNEVQMLRGMRDSLVPKLPVSQRAELKTRLDDAIKSENYELAAILRDELKNLKE